MDPGPNQATESAAPHKQTKKEFVLHEAREVLFMIVYLAISLSLIATFRCLVLAQNGTNDFVHSYIVAVALAVALGKIVVLGQKLPFVGAFNHRPLIYSVLYKAALMTMLADLGSKLEEKMLPALHASSGSTVHQLVLLFTHQMALMCIFIVLFTWRDLDRVLGHGALFKLFFRPRDATPAQTPAQPPVQTPIQPQIQPPVQTPTPPPVQTPEQPSAQQSSPP